MTIPQIEIRDGVHNKISTDISDGNYSYETVNLEKTYYPQANLENLKVTPHIKVVGMGYAVDRTRPLRDRTKLLLSLPVQVAIQKRVEVTNTAEIDLLVTLIDEVMNSITDDELVTGADYTFERIEQLKDENGLPYSYEQLTEQGVFQGIFNSYYQYIRQP